MWVVGFDVAFFEHILGAFSHFLFPFLTQIFIGVYLGIRAFPPTPFGSRSVNLEDVDFFGNDIGHNLQPRAHGRGRDSTL